MLRGQAGVGAAGDEVLAEFPGRELLPHIKSDDPDEGEVLAERLTAEPHEQVADLTVYGGDAPVAALRERMPEVRVASQELIVGCLTRYAAMGWTGLVPDTCSGMQLHVPESYGPWLWGWPTLFTERMAEVDTRVVLVAGDGGWSEGFDTVESVERIPEGFHGLVWTNRADLTAEAISSGPSTSATD